MKLFEGYFDSVERDDDIVKDVEDNSIDDIEKTFNHHIDIAYRTSAMYIAKKANGFDKIIKHIITTFLDKCDFIEYYKIVYKDINNTYDTFKEALESTERYNTSIRILFNTDDSLSYRAIMNILYVLLLMSRKLDKTLPNIVYSEGFILDDNENFVYDNFICNAIKNKIYRDNKEYKVIKHFILQLNKKRAIAKQLDGKIDDYDNYKGLHIKNYEFYAMFCSYEDMKKCIIHTVNDLLYIDIPENQVVHMQGNRSSMYGKIRVKGTLVLEKHLVGHNPYHNNDYSLARYLDDDFLHNHIIYHITFEDAPYFSDISSNLDMCKKKIINLDVISDDMYIDDEDELKSIVKLVNTDNVTMTNYIIKDDE